MLKNFLSWKQSPDDLQTLKLTKTRSSLPQKHSNGCALVENSFSSHTLILKNDLFPCRLFFFCVKYNLLQFNRAFGLWDSFVYVAINWGAQ